MLLHCNVLCVIGWQKPLNLIERNQLFSMETLIRRIKMRYLLRNYGCEHLIFNRLMINFEWPETRIVT